MTAVSSTNHPSCAPPQRSVLATAHMNAHMTTHRPRPRRKAGWCSRAARRRGSIQLVGHLGWVHQHEASPSGSPASACSPPPRDAVTRPQIVLVGREDEAPGGRGSSIVP